MKFDEYEYGMRFKTKSTEEYDIVCEFLSQVYEQRLRRTLMKMRKEGIPLTLVNLKTNECL